MRTLALDPSSTAVGWALFAGPKLEAAGVLRPEHRADPPLCRIVALVDRVASLVTERQPGRIVIEIPSGHAGRASKGGATGQLAIYGMAVGAIWIDTRSSAACSVVGGCDVLTCTEAAWTRGRRKLQRAELIRLEHPDLDWEADTGLDMADAIGIGQWYLDTSPVAEADVAAPKGKRRARCA